MRRAHLTNYIEEKFAILQVRVESRGKLNVLDFHIHSENFYRDLLNLLYKWNLENANTMSQNIEVIDLCDKKNKILIQVSATSTKAKIESALNKGSIEKYKKEGYNFKFVSISKPVGELKKRYFVINTISFLILRKIYMILIPSDDIYKIWKWEKWKKYIVL